MVQAGWQVPTCHLERLRLARDLSCDSEVAGVRPAWLLLPLSADSPVEKLLVQDLFLQYPPSSECGTVGTGLFRPPASEPGQPKAAGMVRAQGFSSRDHSDISTNTIYSISLLSPTSSAHNGLEPTSSTLEGQMNGHRWICLSCVMNCQILPTLLMPYVLWRNIHNG